MVTLNKTKAFLKSNFMMLVVMTTTFVTLVYVENVHSKLNSVEFTVECNSDHIYELNKKVESVENSVDYISNKVSPSPAPSYQLQHAPLLGVQTPTDPDCTD